MRMRGMFFLMSINILKDFYKLKELINEMISRGDIQISFIKLLV